MNPNPLKSRLVFALLITALGWTLWRESPAASAGQPAPDAASSEVAALKAELGRVKTLLPDQSHAMKDVAYHFANLWFAGQHRNWPLAEFYWNETRSHLRWATRIIPVRKDPQGREIHLPGLLAGIESASLEPIHAALKAQDQERFQAAYRLMLGSCFACHAAAGKPYLMLQVPAQPEVPIIRFEPAP